jgi:hypothetical protein
MHSVEAYYLGARWGRVVSFGPHNRSGRFWGRENLLPLPRFKPRTVKPLASRNTNDSIPALRSLNTVLSVEGSGRGLYYTLSLYLEGSRKSRANTFRVVDVRPRLELGISGIQF